MPMRSWGSALAAAGLVLAGCAAARPVARAGGGTLAVAIAGRPTPVKVALVSADIDAENDHQITPLGTRGPFLLVADSYASRAQSMSRCQAGHETWVRLIDTRTRAERWSKRVESCLHDVEPGDPKAAWADVGQAFTVNLLSEPSVHVSISGDGRIAVHG